MTKHNWHRTIIIGFWLSNGINASKLVNGQVGWFYFILFLILSLTVSVGYLIILSERFDKRIDERFWEKKMSGISKKDINSFMGWLDPYKEVKEAVNQLDRHMSDTYAYRSSPHFMYIGTDMEPDITPAPDLEEVIIRTSLNPNL